MGKEYTARRLIALSNGTTTLVDSESGARLAAIEDAMASATGYEDAERLLLERKRANGGLKGRQWLRLFGLHARYRSEQIASQARSLRDTDYVEVEDE